MPTTVLAGFEVGLYVSADNVTYVEAGEVQNLTLNKTASEINANANNETTYEQVIQGRIKWTASGSMNYLPANAGQVLIETQYDAKSAIYVKVVARKLVGAKKWTGLAAITDFSTSFQDASPQARSFSFSGNGALTAGTVVSGDLV